MKTFYKPMLLKCKGDSSCIKIAITDFIHRDYAYEFTFATKNCTEELAKLLLDNSQKDEKTGHYEIKITSRVFKGLMHSYSNFITDIIKKADLQAIKDEYGLANLGIAYEYYYKLKKGYTKTGTYDDKIKKIDVTKSNSRVQLKACFIVDNKKGAYSTCHSVIV